MIDKIFGDLSKTNVRVAVHQEMLAGVRHFHQTIPLDPLPGQPISFRLTTSGPQPFERAMLRFSLDGSDPAGSQAQQLELSPAKVGWDEISWDYVRGWEVSLPPQTAGTLIRYHMAARPAGAEDWIFADNQAAAAAEATDFAVLVDEDPPPAWAREALVYQVFVDRFNPGGGKSWNKVSRLDDFFGGTIRGISEKLDHIQSLGFNTIWLSPFFKTSSHHGYNGSDYYTVEPRLGTNADLRELIDQAHARGMRMLLDFVANHWSSDHPTFQDALKNPKSAFRDWYVWNHWPDDYECYFGVKELPKINLQPGGARDEMINVAQHWLRQGFDGYRLDFAYGPPHDFWVDFRRACRKVRADAWIFGEVIHTPVVQRSLMGRMDGTLDFLLTRALRETFAFGRMSLGEFEAFLTAHESYFPTQSNFSRPSFLDNHDMSRFLYIAGESAVRLELAALVLYTLSGPPIVYNGTETGVSQERPMQQGERYIFEEARQPIDWEHVDAELQEYFRKLGRLRSTYPVLRDGRRHLLHLDAGHGTYAYSREEGQAKVVVALNLSASPRTVQVPAAGLASDAQDRLNGQPVARRGDVVEIRLGAQSGALIA
jgi:cyclomaltodextrinase / maltogenic alpha-amylase / neopullulanase